MHLTTARFMKKLEQMRELHLAKSADYGTTEDPFANIRNSAAHVDIEAWRGCLLRVQDKMQRLHSYCIHGKLTCEGVTDTFLDAAAYLLICSVLHDEENGNVDNSWSASGSTPAQSK